MGFWIWRLGRWGSGGIMDRGRGGEKKGKTNPYQKKNFKLNLKVDEKGKNREMNTLLSEFSTLLKNYWWGGVPTNLREASLYIILSTETQYM